MNSWWTMGAYTAYVWPVYGLVLTVFAGQIINTYCFKKRTIKRLQQWFKRAV